MPGFLSFLLIYFPFFLKTFKNTHNSLKLSRNKLRTRVGSSGERMGAGLGG